MSDRSESKKTPQKERAEANLKFFVGVFDNKEEFKGFEDPFRNHADPKKEADKPRIPISVQGRQDAGKFSLSGGTWEGLPYKGPSYNLKEEDPEHMRPQLRRKANVRQFRTWVPEEMEAWERVAQGVASRVNILSFEEKEFVPEKEGWIILCRWMEQYYEAPDFVKEK